MTFLEMLDETRLPSGHKDAIWNNQHVNLIMQAIYRERDRVLYGGLTRPPFTLVDFRHAEEEVIKALLDLVKGYLADLLVMPTPEQLLQYPLNGPAWAIAQLIAKARSYQPEYR